MGQITLFKFLGNCHWDNGIHLIYISSETKVRREGIINKETLLLSFFLNEFLTNKSSLQMNRRLPKVVSQHHAERVPWEGLDAFSWQWHYTRKWWYALQFNLRKTGMPFITERLLVGLWLVPIDKYCFPKFIIPILYTYFNITNEGIVSGMRHFRGLMGYSFCSVESLVCLSISYA